MSIPFLLHREIIWEYVCFFVKSVSGVGFNIKEGFGFGAGNGI
jgi:hypothetical protein